MSLNRFFQFLVPKDTKFFPLFEQASAALILLAETLHEAVNAPKEQREDSFRKIAELEGIIEEITHKTHLELSKNFITPFDREDIHYLATATEDSAKKSTQVQPVRIVQAPSPTVTTNTFLSTNSDLTKALLSNVFDSSTKQRDLQVQQIKQSQKMIDSLLTEIGLLKQLVGNTKNSSSNQQIIGTIK